jgi:hypothetical protein
MVHIDGSSASHLFSKNRFFANANVKANIREWKAYPDTEPAQLIDAADLSERGKLIRLLMRKKK